MAQRIARLSRQTSLLFLCDMQEKFRSTIKYFPQIVETSNKLLQVCKILDVPFIVTEQYPKGSIDEYECFFFTSRKTVCLGLGRTVSELDIGNVKPLEKTLFSMCTAETIAQMKEKNKGMIHFVSNRNHFDFHRIFRFQYGHHLWY